MIHQVVCHSMASWYVGGGLVSEGYSEVTCMREGTNDWRSGEPVLLPRWPQDTGAPGLLYSTIGHSEVEMGDRSGCLAKF